MSTKFSPLTFRLARVRRGLRQRDLAEQVGMAPQRISDFETGVRRPTPEQMASLARVLGLIGATRKSRSK